MVGCGEGGAGGRGAWTHLSPAEQSRRRSLPHGKSPHHPRPPHSTAPLTLWMPPSLPTASTPQSLSVPSEPPDLLCTESSAGSPDAAAAMCPLPLHPPLRAAPCTADSPSVPWGTHFSPCQGPGRSLRPAAPLRRRQAPPHTFCRWGSQSLRSWHRLSSAGAGSPWRWGGRETGRQYQQHGVQRTGAPPPRQQSGLFVPHNRGFQALQRGFPSWLGNALSRPPTAQTHPLILHLYQTKATTVRRMSSSRMGMTMEAVPAGREVQVQSERARGPVTARPGSSGCSSLALALPAGRDLPLST